MDEKIDKKLEKRLSLGKADLHIHTNFSDAKARLTDVLKYVEEKTDLNVIAITDHDTIDGAIEAQRIIKEEKYRFEVIIGEEVSTIEGHVIGLFLKKAIPAGLSAKEAIKKIKDQNGLVIMPHPLRHIRFNTGEKNIDGVGFMVLLREKNNIDGIEIINATPTFHGDNLKAMFFNDTLLFKAGVGNSDAHIKKAIGMGYTVFEGKTAKDLRAAIENCQTKAFDKRWGILGLFNYAFFFLPQGLRLFVNTLLHGRKPKRLQINFPKGVFKNYRIKPERKKEYRKK